MEKKISVKLFGICSEIAGHENVDVPFQDRIDSQQLLDQLKIRFPELQKINSLSLAVNHAYVQATVELHPNDELALIPPVSGG